METIKSFFGYFLDPTPGPDFGYSWHMFILSILLIIGAIVFNTYYKNRKKTDIPFKKLFPGVSTQMLTFGILILILTGIRYENIPYFSMRLWFAATLVVFIYYIYKNIQLWRKEYPQMLKENEQINKTRKVNKKTYSASKKR